MRRVMILGCAGSGKSTLARRLGERLGLPVVHIDNLQWEPGWIAADDAVFRDRVAKAVASDAWVTDGNYVSRTFPLRLPRADTVILLRRPRWLLLWRVIKRGVTFWGKERPDLAVGCPDKVDWPFLTFVWNFDKTTTSRIEAIMAKAPPGQAFVRLTSDRAVEAFLAGLP
jgi:adenylate kinase family enzyme